MNKTAKKIGGITLSAVMAMSLALTATPATPVSAATTCTVYFDNSDNWDEVYVYFTTDAVAWSDAGFTDAAISDSDGDGWYEFEISTDTDAYVIFTTSNGGWEAQTCNIFIPAGTTEGWAAYADYENGSDPLDISTTAPEGFTSSVDEGDTTNSEEAESSETSEASEASEAESSEEETASVSASADTTCTVYFDNSDNWDEVYVYFTTDAEAWSDAGFTDAPISDSDGDGWYEFEISTDTDAYVIFTTSNGGWEAQTCNIFIPAGTTKGWVAYADYENGSDPLDISTTAPEGFTTTADDNEGSSEESGTSTVTETSEVSSDSSDTSIGTTETGDAAPIAAAAVALLGCAVVVFASRRKAA